MGLQHTQIAEVIFRQGASARLQHPVADDVSHAEDSQVCQGTVIQFRILTTQVAVQLLDDGPVTLNSTAKRDESALDNLLLLPGRIGYTERQHTHWDNRAV